MSSHFGIDTARSQVGCPHTKEIVLGLKADRVKSTVQWNTRFQRNGKVCFCRERLLQRRQDVGLQVRCIQREWERSIQALIGHVSIFLRCFRPDNGAS